MRKKIISGAVIAVFAILATFTAKNSMAARVRQSVAIGDEVKKALFSNKAGDYYCCKVHDFENCNGTPDC